MISEKILGNGMFLYIRVTHFVDEIGHHSNTIKRNTYSKVVRLKGYYSVQENHKKCIITHLTNTAI